MVVTGLVAAVAILGTIVYFLSGNLHSIPSIPTVREQPKSEEQSQVESIRVTNVHAWVSHDNTSVTAFAIQNEGSKLTTVNSIAMRGLPVPTAQWYSCSPTDTALCSHPNNINTELKVDYNPSDGVSLAQGYEPTYASGSISLASGQATIVYVVEAGAIDAIDAGNTYGLQIQAGQASSVTNVLVVSAD